MELPLGFDAPESQNRKHYVLQLNKSLYGLKHAGYNWFAKLSNGLEDVVLFLAVLILVSFLVKDSLYSHM